MAREGPALGGAGPSIASHLSHPGASTVSEARRSRCLSVYRCKTCSELEHAAYVPADTLYPVIRYDWGPRQGDALVTMAHATA